MPIKAGAAAAVPDMAFVPYAPAGRGFGPFRTSWPFIRRRRSIIAGLHDGGDDRLDFEPTPDGARAMRAIAIALLVMLPLWALAAWLLS